MDVVKREVDKVPIFELDENYESQLNANVNQLMEEYFEYSQSRDRRGEIISTTELNFDAKKSKPIIDNIDEIILDGYDFNEAEIDFILNLPHGR